MVRGRLEIPLEKSGARGFQKNGARGLQKNGARKMGPEVCRKMGPGCHPILLIGNTNALKKEAEKMKNEKF